LGLRGLALPAADGQAGSQSQGFMEAFAMEQSQRSVIALIALIFGACFLAFLCVRAIRNLNEDGYVRNALSNNPALLERYDKAALEATFRNIWEEQGGAWGYISDGVNIWNYICMPVLAVLALFFNVFGWLKTRAKNMLIAAILYAITFNIPSAALCFIDYSKRR